MQRKPDDADTAASADPRPRLSVDDRFSRVVEASPTALVLTGQTGRIDLVNRRAERMFGYGRAELRNQPLELLMPERFRGRHVDLRRQFIDHMASRMMGEGWALFGLRRDGTEFPIEIGLNPIELDGEPMVLAGIVDVTARHAIELQQARQRRELERSNAELQEFAYVASHDLKAPLRAIGHLADWIGEDIGTTASTDTLDNLKLLRGRVTRMQAMLDGLLAYARVGRTQAPIEDVNIAEVVDEIVAVLAPRPGFVVACEGRMGVLRTHRMPIRVVLDNLISNGLKHHDRAEGRITVAMCKSGDVAEFRVSDDGPGIASRFQTLTSRDEVEANGLGLAIVKKKVQAHGGHIRVESAPPARGTSFVFTWQGAVV
jgi:PAS domain S-box-containing protein